MKSAKKRRILAGVLAFLAVLAFVGSRLLFRVSDYYSQVNRLNAHFVRKDAKAARAELEELRGYDGLAENWPLNYVSERMFADSWLYDASYSYITGDYKAVLEKVSTVNDYRARHLEGCARFRMAQSDYAAGNKDVSLKTVLDEINPIFESAVREAPESDYDDKWNYDLTSNPNDAERALSGEGKLPVRFILGFDPNEDVPKKVGPNPDEGELELGTGREGEGAGKRRKKG